jgi:hypothetical protein
MTAVEKYIESLKKYKVINGTIDDAIIIAETLLIELERKQIIDIVEKSRVTGLTAEYLLEQLKSEK